MNDRYKIRDVMLEKEHSCPYCGFDGTVKDFTLLSIKAPRECRVFLCESCGMHHEVETGLVLKQRAKRRSLIDAGQLSIFYELMVTQEWAYYHAQLDFAPSRRIKIHIMRESERSLCGLVNKTDTGTVMWDGVVNYGDDVCEKCLKSAMRERGSFEVGLPFQASMVQSP